jgi:hypothetical protein
MRYSGLRLFAARRFGTVPDDPTGEMPDDGACCGRECLSSSSLSFCVAARRRVSGHAPLTSQRSILRCPCYPHQGIPKLISVREAATPPTPAVYPAVSVKHSKQETAESSGRNPQRPTTLHVETVEAINEYDHGSSPRL